MTYKLQYLGAGSYNRVYKVLEESTKRILGVFKLSIFPMPTDPSVDEQHYVDASLDTIQRSLYIWNEINPFKPANEFSVEKDGQKYTGWLSPFIDGRQASDQEIVNTLVDIYNRTGRIVVDAVGTGNVLIQEDGSAICIDIGCALKLDSVYGPLARIRDTTLHGDRADFPGVAHWRGIQLSKFEPYYKRMSARRPLSINAIKALLFLNRHKPDVSKVDFLLNKNIAEKFAEAYVQELFNPETFDGGEAVFKILKDSTGLDLIEPIPRSFKTNVEKIGFFRIEDDPFSVPLSNNTPPSGGDAESAIESSIESLHLN